MTPEPRNVSGNAVETRGLLLAILIAVAVATASALVLPLGFQGRDDLHYLLAAEHWLHGPALGTDHWSNRIPYVTAITSAFRVVGSWEAGLYLIHAISFVIVATCIWIIGRRSFDQPAAAWFGLAILCATPLLFRLPSTFYPEAVEIALSAVPAVIVLGRQRLGAHATAWLFFAGVIGGIVLSIRQTALALPLAFALVIMLDRSEPISARIRNVATLAIGYSVPVLAELAYYWAMTGNPLYRLSVDTRHIELVSPDRLIGGVPPTSQGVLFNWDLASRWNIPSTVQSHWTISPIVRLFTSPGMLLTPWFALAGGILAWRRGGQARSVAVLTLLTFAIQYVSNTFVLALPPNTRYFGLSLALMSLLAGLALASIPRRAIAWMIYIILFLGPSLLVSIAQPRPSVTIDLLERTAAVEPERIFVIGQLAKMAELRTMDDRELRSEISHDSPPVGGLIAGLIYDRPADASRRCADGSPAYRPIKQVLPRSLIWETAIALRVSSVIPGRAAKLINGQADAFQLTRRVC